MLAFGCLWLSLLVAYITAFNPFAAEAYLLKHAKFIFSKFDIFVPIQ